MTTRAQVVTARDQTIGIRAVNPSVSGIANERRKRITHAMKRAVAAADTICAVVTARDSGEDEAKKLAQMLLNSPEFTGAMIKSLRSLLAELEAAVPASKPNDKPASADPDPANPEGIHGGADNPESPSPNNVDDPKRGSGMPGADSGTLPGSYSEAHLIRDLATQNAAAVKLALHVGTDAANARVADDPLVPAWDSPVWSAEAREAFRARAAGDGWAAAHMRGEVPAIDQYFR